MYKKVISATLALSAIALNADLLSAQESDNQRLLRRATTEPTLTVGQNAPGANTVFVCATQNQPPTLFAYTPGKVDLTSLMSWHQDYLLPGQSGIETCQQVAAKLQNRLQNQQSNLFVSEQKEDRNVLCLVTQENADCNSSDSEELFSVKPQYDATCVVDNREPLECLAIAQDRGVIKTPDNAYSPAWWPW